MDFYPTILEITRTSLASTNQLDGVSLVPVLKGGTIPSRPLFWHYPHYGNQGGEPSAIMMLDHWKLIHYFEDGRNELYDLSADIGEKNDLARFQAERVATMVAALGVWQKEVNATFPTSNSKYNPQQAAQELQKILDQGIPAREKQNAAIMRPDYTPAGGWWDQRGAQSIKSVKEKEQ